MRLFLVTCLFFLVSTLAYAQANKNEVLYSKKVVTFNKMRRIGIVTTILGSVANIVGVITISNSKVITNYDAYGYPQSVTTGTPLTGLVEVLAGSTALSAGIPLWIIGGINHKKYERKLNGVTLNFNISPAKAGLKFTYRF